MKGFGGNCAQRRAQGSNTMSQLPDLTSRTSRFWNVMGGNLVQQPSSFVVPGTYVFSRRSEMYAGWKNNIFFEALTGFYFQHLDFTRIQADRVWVCLFIPEALNSQRLWSVCYYRKGFLRQTRHCVPVLLSPTHAAVLTRVLGSAGRQDFPSRGIVGCSSYWSLKGPWKLGRPLMFSCAAEGGAKPEAPHPLFFYPPLPRKSVWVRLQFL